MGNIKIKKIIMVAIFLTFFSTLFAQKNITLILALDDSGSMKPYWQAAVSTLFSIIDGLKPGDKVFPIAFSTYARHLSNPIIINGPEDKLYLRSLYQKLSPSGQWTYFKDLIDVCREIFNSDSTAILICITDAISDPGPGRKDDIDITRLAELKQKFPGGGVYVLRLTDKKTEITSDIQNEQKSLKEGGVISVFLTDERILEICQSLISALREANQLAKEILEKYSQKIFDTSSNQNPEISQSQSEEAQKSEIINPPSNLELKKTTTSVDSLVFKGMNSIKKFFNNKKWRLLLFVSLFLIIVVLIGILIKFRKSNGKEKSEEAISIENITPYEEEYYLILKSPFSSFSYPLRKGQKLTLGTDVPLGLSETSPIGIISWEKDALYFEPMTKDNIILLNEKKITQKTKIKPLDVITFKDCKITISTKPDLPINEVNVSGDFGEEKEIDKEGDNLLI
ncbi:MAG: vWA domain-containing protein [candidate division WOR-3 bacterium]